MKIFGFILLLVGIMGVAFVLSLGAYWLFGWIGVVLFISVLSICAGGLIMNDDIEMQLGYED